MKENAGGKTAIGGNHVAGPLAIFPFCFLEFLCCFFGRKKRNYLFLKKKIKKKTKSEKTEMATEQMRTPQTNAAPQPTARAAHSTPTRGRGRSPGGEHAHILTDKRLPADSSPWLSKGMRREGDGPRWQQNGGPGRSRGAEPGQSRGRTPGSPRQGFFFETPEIPH